MKRHRTEKMRFHTRYRDFSELYFNRSGFCLLRFFPATNNADRLMYFKRFGVITKSTFSVLFYLKRQAERNGKVPLTGRIAVDGTISQFCGQRPVSPELCLPQTTKRPTKVSRPGISTRHRNRHRQAVPAHWRPECVCDRRKDQERAVGVRSGYRPLYCRLSTSISKNSSKNGELHLSSRKRGNANFPVGET